MNALQYLYAFLVGGAICMIGQILIIRTNITSARILVIFLMLGSFLQGMGVYDVIFKVVGAGISVPIIGFGAALARGAMDAVKNDGVLGIFTGGLGAAAGGLAAAIFFGFVMSLIFKSRTKQQ